MREKISNLIDAEDYETIGSKFYNYFMIVVIIVSIVPLLTHTSNVYLWWIDKITAGIFIADYVLRWITADISNHNKNKKIEFVKYPFRFMAIMDLISILPSFISLFPALRVLKFFRFARILRVFRVIRYSSNVKMIVKVLKAEKKSLLTITVLALGYCFVAALIMFNVEPKTFPTFFDAFYWAAISLTTVGYGDVYATSQFGKVITMISAFVGCAIIALPASCITSGYLSVLEEEKKGE